MTGGLLIDGYVMGQSWISPETNCLNNRIYLNPRAAKTDKTSGWRNEFELPDEASRSMHTCKRRMKKETANRDRKGGLGIGSPWWSQTKRSVRAPASIDLCSRGTRGS